MIADGITFNFGLLYFPMVETFKESYFRTGITTSIFYAMPQMMGPVVSVLIGRYGCRRVCIVGSIMTTLGFVVSFWGTSNNFLCISLGLVCGVGLGLLYMPATIIVAYYFEKKRALATGIAVSGSGVGTLVFAPLMEILLDAFGFHGTMLILGGISLHCLISAALFRPYPHLTASIPVEVPAHSLPASPKALSRQPPVEVSIKKVTIDTMVLPPTRKISAVANGNGVPGNGVQQRAAGLSQSMVITRDYIDIGSLEDGEGDTIINKSLLKHFRKTSLSLTNLPTTIDACIHSVIQFPTYYNPPDDVKTVLTNQTKMNETETSLTTNQEEVRQDSAVKKAALTRLQQTTAPPASQIRGDRRLLRQRRAIFALDTVLLHQQHCRHFPSCPELISMRSVTQMKNHHLSSSCAKGPSLGSNIPSLNGSAPHRPLVLQPPPIKQSPVHAVANENTCSCCPASCWSICNPALFCNWPYLVFVVSNMVLYMWYDITYLYLPDYARENGLTQGEHFMSILGITNTMGQIGVGYLSDRMSSSTVFLYAIFILLTGLTTCVVPFLSTYWPLAIYSGLYGIFISANYSLVSIIIVELSTLDNLTTGYGIMMFVQGVANLIGPPIGGKMRDYMGDYYWTFWIAGIFIAASAIMLTPVVLVQKVPRFKRLFRKSSSSIYCCCYTPLEASDSIEAVELGRVNGIGDAGGDSDVELEAVKRPLVSGDCATLTESENLICDPLRIICISNEDISLNCNTYTL